MELSPRLQILELIKKSKNILLAAASNLNGDSIASLLGFSLVLKKINAGDKKELTLALSEKPSKKFSFLPDYKTISDKISRNREFIININTASNKIDSLRYEKEEANLKIFLSPNASPINEKDIVFSQGKFQYDLALILNTPGLEDLGELFEEMPELFFETPLVNIDRHPSNENFGQINLIELTAGSVSEILHDLIESWDGNLIDEEIATCLLTGIIGSTRNFQAPSTNPQSFSHAASLIGKGGDRETIIRHLYKTKPLNLLKLWGEIMSELKYNEEKRILWTKIPAENFEKTQTSPEDINFILEEINNNFPLLNSVLILWAAPSLAEKKNIFIQGLIQISNSEKLKTLQEKLGGKIKENNLFFETKSQDFSKEETRILELLNSLL